MSLLDDLLDRGATSKEGRRFIDFALAIVPAFVTSVLPIYGPFSDWLRHIPGAGRAVHIMVPTLLLMFAIHMITSKHRHAVSLGFATAQGSQQTYRYSTGSRLAAKIALPPLFLLMCAESYDKLPNWMFGRERVRAYVCRAATLSPIAGSTAYLIDSFGGQVSALAESDDTGYLNLRLSSWGQRPTAYKLYSPCSITMPLPNEETGAGCPGTSNATLPVRPRSIVWRLTCSD